MSRSFIFRRLESRLFIYSSRRGYASRTFQDGDVVVLRPFNDPKSTSLNTLDSNRTYQTPHGSIKATDILQQPVHGLTVRTKKGISYRVSEPSLAEYVTLTKRLVTPIYQDHANLIVNLLDLHPLDSTQIPHKDERIEILEAGTGHGSLTLCLARAIHAANGPMPEGEEDGLKIWRESRKAVLHTVDISAAHSMHAQKIVQGFRHGLYAGNIDFHIGDLSAFFETEKQPDSSSKGDRFLSHVILDMPSSSDQLALVSKHMRNDAKLLVFNPSVTQIADCVQTIHEQKLPFRLEKVVELAGSFSGGREWDLRIARIKKPNGSAPQAKVESQSWFGKLFGSLFRSQPSKSEEVQKYAMVCRPMAGDRIVVGGFVGLWKRTDN